jgi:hypothetical protein
MALVTVHPEFKYLRETTATLFKITNKAIDHQNIGQCLKAIKLNNSVTHYVFCLNDIGDTLAILITEELIKKERVHSIYFWANQITNRGFIEIARLTSNTRIKFLDFSRNYINDQGILAGFSYIAKSSLTGIDLSHNKISNEGSEYISLILRTTDSLSKINLSSNRVAEVGIKPWIVTLKGLQFVTEINLSGNPNTDPVTLIHLKSLITTNRSSRENSGKAVLKVSRYIMKIKGLPVEIKDMILMEFMKGYSNNDTKTLMYCLKMKCFLGWIHCNFPFGPDELVRRCETIMKDKDEFIRLAGLIEKRDVIRKRYEVLKAKHVVEKKHERLMFPICFMILFNFFKSLFKRF